MGDPLCSLSTISSFRKENAGCYFPKIRFSLPDKGLVKDVPYDGIISGDGAAGK